jgi:hypothetical protein
MANVETVTKIVSMVVAVAAFAWGVYQFNAESAGRDETH